MYSLLVYGTLRRMNPDAEIVKVKGKMFNCGSFPAVILDENSETEIVCERIIIDDRQLERFDAYEGYDRDNPRRSHYIRRTLDNGDFIYEYNRNTQHLPEIEGGDWAETEGRYNAFA